MTKLIVICGATATGKSSLALTIAMQLGTVILSADSRQVYREFDIGTAKPTGAEQKLVPHYLIDICDPKEIMTVADYQERAQALISSPPFQAMETRREGDAVTRRNVSKNPRVSEVPLLVGGTGLYIRSITQGMKIPRVAPHKELRSQLESLSQVQLYAMLQQVDSVAAQKIHPHDSVRTLRALEVYYVTGRPISEQQGENPPNYPILQIGLDCDSAHLGHRIAQRTEQMIADGLVSEVERLCQKYGADLPLLNTLGYQEIKQYLAGDISLDKAKELTVLHTRQFAKRQRTWFHAYSQIEWFDVESSDLLDKVWLRVQEFITNSSRVELSL
ncbi:tRNA (adenosine(37)-N6)-dimethylallyltransferase MiaA [Chlorogloeopsis sp. ULAP01]|uniref:tRNA (adenosine(37)-N6)-dimethylallyltransferase MiaA n=1 Tax=Chlorogloeopsis sp. ULAP01 TaxID=3056483 RepID=UPI0025AB166A|nr:tRNA (adenosine(37)-N6)-dimethylallyltransferase MiaA [Chlorogloeopsis sp. ULAP01]MDM9381572.1 tRNA (adenosine(37)-N6)-dimethylallyltransferase MiaA [Chlorogloeopsis sp. ULAP01]